MLKAAEQISTSPAEEDDALRSVLVEPTRSGSNGGSVDATPRSNSWSASRKIFG